MLKNLIFDFDGVLADTLEITIKTDMAITNSTYEESKKRQLENFNVNFLLHTYKDKAEELKLFGDKFTKLAIEEGRIFEEFLEELENIQEEHNDIRMAIVSSGSEDYIKPLLEASGHLYMFDPILCRKDGFSKKDKVQLVTDLWEVDIKECAFFADTINDIIELKDMFDKRHLFGCGWGFHGVEKLQTVLEDSQILQEYGEINLVLD